MAEVGILSAQATGDLRTSPANHVAILSDAFMRVLLSPFLAIVSVSFFFPAVVNSFFHKTSNHSLAAFLQAVASHQVKTSSSASKIVSCNQDNTLYHSVLSAADSVINLSNNNKSLSEAFHLYNLPAANHNSVASLSSIACHNQGVILGGLIFSNHSQNHNFLVS